MLRNLFFMIGAHKTASTHFQRSMVANADVLAPYDVSIVPPVPIGANLFPIKNLLREKVDAKLLQAAGERFLETYGKDAKSIMLMNENIPGTLGANMLLAGDQLYKFGPKRLKRMLTLFPGHHHVIGLAIRNPATFVVSAWQEHLKGQQFHSFDDYIKGINLNALSWVNYIERMRNAVETDLPFVVWRYEDYAEVRNQIVALFAAPEAVEKITWLEETSNQGLSANAIDFLKAVGHVSKKNRADAMEMFPRGPDAPPFSPFTANQTAELTALYNEQWATIQRMAGVHALTS